jgi:hypothetical protein
MPALTPRANGFGDPHVWGDVAKLSCFTFTYRQLDRGDDGAGGRCTSRCRGRWCCHRAVNGGGIRCTTFLTSRRGGRCRSGCRLLMAGGVHGVALASQTQGHNLASKQASGDVLVVKLTCVLEEEEGGSGGGTMV